MGQCVLNFVIVFLLLFVNNSNYQVITWLTSSDVDRIAGETTELKTKPISLFSSRFRFSVPEFGIVTQFAYVIAREGFVMNSSDLR